MKVSIIANPASLLCLCAPLALLSAGGSALAQQNAAKAPAAAATTRNNATSVVLLEDDKRVELKIENDKVISAKVNGKEIDLKNVKRSGGNLKIVDSDGDVLFETDSMPVGDAFAAGGAARNQADIHSDFMQRKRLADAVLGGLGGNRVIVGGEPGNAEAGAMWAPPKTMLGVTLDRPDTQLSKHLGIDADAVTLITGAVADLPAAKAGIQAYDVIVAVEGKTPASPAQIRERMGKLNVGDKITFTVIHQGQKKDVAVTVDAYDAKKLSVLEPEAGDGRVEVADAMAKKFDQFRNMPEMRMMPKAGGGGGKIIIERDVDGKKERIERDLNDNLADIFAPGAPPAPPAPPGGGIGRFVVPGGDDRLNDRLDRLEKRLDELMKRLEKLNR